MTDFVDGLSDAELRTKLAEYGFPLMPITVTTRKLMAKKLKLLIENKNKINTEGRRSLTKYSSEEESDTEVKVKRDKRRQTVAAVLQPPISKPSRKSTRFASKDEDIPPPQTTTVTTSATKTTRRTTRLIKPVQDADFETGSDSEPEIVEDDIIAAPIKTTPSFLEKPAGRTATPYPPVVGRQQTNIADTKTVDYNSPRSQTNSSYSRYSSASSNISQEPGDSWDRINQIRSRLSLGTAPERSTLDKKFITTDNDTVETPFLSNFTRRLSQLSSNAPPLRNTDYGFKNDIIKEHDANGSSTVSSYNRHYLSRARTREYPQDFKSNQEKNIFKINFVSFALVGIVVTFFLIISLMYMGIQRKMPLDLDITDFIKRNLPFLNKN